MLRQALALSLVVTPLSPVFAGSSAAMDSQTMVDLVARLIPTVVNVTAHHVTAPPRDAAATQGAAFARVRTGVGSGFVIDPSGSIVTNRHVVEGAYDLTVTFSDGRTVPAQLVWTSMAVDVAFLKVSVDKPLPVATLAADQSVRIGQRVIAIGNPLGLGTSVSAGIVSAVDRDIKESPYDAFIQTDAAINHGNSGGPLFNEAGEVVGINSALYTSTSNGGSQGLGFAIPGRDVIFLIDEFKRYGRVRAGWLGLNAQKLTSDMAEALRFPGFFGAIVATVAPNSPAAAAGLRSGDIVQTFGDEPIEDATTLNRATALSLGKHVQLGLWRDGKPLTVSVTIAEDPQSHGAAAQPYMDASGPRFASTGDMGLLLAPLTGELRQRFKLQAGVRGLVVTAVAEDSVAQEVGLRAGDVIVTAQMQPATDVDDLDRLILTQASSGRHAMIVLVQASGGERWVALPLRL